MDISIITIVILLSIFSIAIILLLGYIVSQQQQPVTVIQEPSPDVYMIGRPYWPNSYWNWYDPGFGPRAYRGWFDHPHIPHPKPPAAAPPPAPQLIPKSNHN